MKLEGLINSRRNNKRRNLKWPLESSSSVRGYVRSRTWLGFDSVTKNFHSWNHVRTYGPVFELFATVKSCNESENVWVCFELPSSESAKWAQMWQKYVIQYDYFFLF